MSRCRQNFHDACEAGLNNQINMELHAMYCYTALAAYFERDDVALSNVAAYFRKNADEERSHAQALIDYLTKRGGRVRFSDIKAPPLVEFASVREAFEAALALERKVNSSLLDLHKTAEENSDPHMTDYLEGNFLNEQVDAIKELAGHVSNLDRVGLGLGEWHFDQSLS